MNIFTDWLHGTSSTITQWTLVDRGALKGLTPLHKGLFSMTNRKFAELSSGCSISSPNVYLANLNLEPMCLIFLNQA